MAVWWGLRGRTLFHQGATVRIEEENIADLRQKFAIDGNLPYLVPSKRGRISDFSIPESSFDWVTDHYGALSAPWHQGCSPCDLLEVVVLLAFMERVPKLPSGRQWYALHQQADGHSCGQYYFVGTQIIPRRSLYPALRQVARDRYPGGRAGWDGSHFFSTEKHPDPELLQAYRSQIAEIGFEYSGNWLVESIYPLDVSQKSLEILTEDSLLLRDFGINSSSDIGATGAVFLVLSENSD